MQPIKTDGHTDISILSFKLCSNIISMLSEPQSLACKPQRQTDRQTDKRTYPYYHFKLLRNTISKLSHNNHHQLYDIHLALITKGVTVTFGTPPQR